MLLGTLVALILEPPDELEDGVLGSLRTLFIAVAAFYFGRVAGEARLDAGGTLVKPPLHSGSPQAEQIEALEDRMGVISMELARLRSEVAAPSEETQVDNETSMVEEFKQFLKEEKPGDVSGEEDEEESGEETHPDPGGGPQPEVEGRLRSKTRMIERLQALNEKQQKYIQSLDRLLTDRGIAERPDFGYEEGVSGEEEVPAEESERPDVQ